MAKIARYVDGLALRAKQINEQVRELIDHPGEKGRAAEHIVRGLVKEILPKKFSIGTGFVVTSHDKRSSQTDIVLFDEQLNAPLSLVGDIGIFPIECVYATIEVKSELSKQTLDDAAKAIGALRKFKNEKYYLVNGLRFDSNGNIVSLQSSDVVQSTLAPRSYIFSFRSQLSMPKIKSLLQNASKEHGAFFHGVVVLDSDLFVHQLITKGSAQKKFKAFTSSSISRFAMKLSTDTIRYPMFPADMNRYLDSHRDEVE